MHKASNYITFALAALGSALPTDPNHVTLDVPQDGTTLTDPGFSLRCLDSPDLKCPPPSSTNPGTFVITDFTFGCTAGCSWQFNVTVENNIFYIDPTAPQISSKRPYRDAFVGNRQHPGTSIPVTLAGDLPSAYAGTPGDTTYVTAPSNSSNLPDLYSPQSIGAWISSTFPAILYLEYLVFVPDSKNPNGGASYNYTANTTVYAATSANAQLQQSNFTVPESAWTGVA